MIKKRLLALCIAVFVVSMAFSQTQRISNISRQLDSLSQYVPVLNDSIDISVTNVSVQEFLRGIALANNVNMSIANGLTDMVINNFNNVKFKDILVFLVKEYNLDIEILGNIIVVKKYQPIPEAPKKYEAKKLQIRKNFDNTFTADLQNDSLRLVVKELAQLSGQNIIIRNDIRDVKVSGYYQNQQIKPLLENIALSNDLEFETASGNTYVFSSQNSTAKRPATGSKSTRPSSSSSSDGEYTFNYIIKNKFEKIISLQAINAPLDTVVRRISDELGLNYRKLTELESSLTIIADSIRYEQLLQLAYKGTKYSYRNIKGVYLLGEEQTAGMHETKLISLEFRTVNKIKEIIPKKLQEGADIIEFKDLNGILVTATPEKVAEIETFIMSIDKSVPVVLIEVIILDVLKTHTVTTGIKAGRGTPKTPSAQTLAPGIDYEFNAQSLNRLLNSFNGFGWFSLGEVAPDFYLQLQALEENGVIKVRSTPKLSTLNGYEATLTSGETRYYLEEQSSTISSTAIQQTNTKQYKSVNADLTIKINPIVSGNGQITLEIEVSQSDFKGSSVAGAPPNSINRKFKSQIRVKNGEMVLLGGLERNETSDKGSGIPVLSRIPVIKWFFSSRSRSKSNSKLDIFIKPTVIY